MHGASQHVHSQQKRNEAPSLTILDARRAPPVLYLLQMFCHNVRMCSRQGNKMETAQRSWSRQTPHQLLTNSCSTFGMRWFHATWAPRLSGSPDPGLRTPSAGPPSARLINMLNTRVQKVDPLLINMLNL